METEKENGVVAAVVLSFKPTYKGWKRTSKATSPLRNSFVLSLPTRDGNNTLIYSFPPERKVLSLPTRDGNAEKGSPSSPWVIGFKPTYKGWKQKKKEEEIMGIAEF